MINKNSNNQIIARRTDLLSLLSKGIKLKDAVDTLSEKYQVSPRDVYHDWEKREQWTRQITRQKDPSYFDILLTGLQEIIRESWYLAKTADNDNAKVGALRLAQDTYFNMIGLLQGLGLGEQGEIGILIRGRWWKQNVNAVARAAEGEDNSAEATAQTPVPPAPEAAAVP
jgi:hypothetical protein